GVECDVQRILLALRARRHLGLGNVAFALGDARTLRLPDGLDGCYVLDLLHHLPRDAARSLIAHVYEQLRPGGVFIVKDVDTRPRYKMVFTWLLDVLMTRGERPRDWSVSGVTNALRTAGFAVIRSDQ